MNPDYVVPTIITLASSVLVLLGGAIGFGVAWIRARDRAQRAERELAQASSTPRGLERLEAAVDSIAVEVERIAEAERFQSQLLAQRTEAAVPERLPAPGRVKTPH